MIKKTIATNQYPVGKSPLERVNDDRLELVAMAEDAESMRDLLLLSQIAEIVRHEVRLAVSELHPVFGWPIEDYLRNSAFNSSLWLEWSSSSKKPFSGPGIKEVTLKIPEPQRYSIEWRKIKQLMGGSDGTRMGQWKCWANVEVSYGISKIVAWGGTEQEADRNFDMISSITSGNILTKHYSKAPRQFNRYWTEDDNRPKKPIQMYPYAFVYLNNRRLKLALAKQERDWGRGRKHLKGYTELNKSRFFLWPKDPPPDFDRRIKQLVVGDVD